MKKNEFHFSGLSLFICRTLMCVLLIVVAGDLRAQNTYSECPLCDAAGRLDVSEVSWLLNAGLDVNMRDEYGHTPLHYAAFPVAVRFLSRPPYCFDNKKTENEVFWQGLSNPHQIEIMGILLDHDADINALDSSGHWTPLFGTARYAILTGDSTPVDFLLARGAVADRGENSPLILALSRCNYGVAKTLLQNGASIGKLELIAIAVGASIALGNITENIKRLIGVSNLDAPAAKTPGR